jgi:hypothetical protein
LQAIQSSAFLMTLYRKRIIRGKTHLGVYSGCLVLSGFHIARLCGVETCGLVLAAFALRVALPRAYSSKYALWAGFLLLRHRAAAAAAVAGGDFTGDLGCLAGAVLAAAAVFGAFRAEAYFRASGAAATKSKGE